MASAEENNRLPDPHQQISVREIYPGDRQQPPVFHPHSPHVPSQQDFPPDYPPRQYNMYVQRGYTPEEYHPKFQTVSMLDWNQVDPKDRRDITSFMNRCVDFFQKNDNLNVKLVSPVKHTAGGCNFYKIAFTNFDVLRNNFFYDMRKRLGDSFETVFYPSENLLHVMIPINMSIRITDTNRGKNYLTTVGNISGKVPDSYIDVTDGRRRKRRKKMKT